MAFHRTAWACLWLLHAVQTCQGQVTCEGATSGATCDSNPADVSSGCASATIPGKCFDLFNDGVLHCAEGDPVTENNVCDVQANCRCTATVCGNSIKTGLCGQVTSCEGLTAGARCESNPADVSSGCALATIPGNCFDLFGDGVLHCAEGEPETENNVCDVQANCLCTGAVCGNSIKTGLCGSTPVCPDGVDMCDDPHMKGLRGQRIDWSGVDGAWYNMIKDGGADLHINVRLTAPLAEEFPGRQLITGLSVLSEGHSLVIEVKNPYDVNTDGCPRGISPCLSDGGLRAVVDGEEAEALLGVSRDESVVDGIIISASNLPAECRQFGGDKIWARMYGEMLEGTRQLLEQEQFEDWVLRFDDMAAPSWCARYIEERDLADLQSIHSVFKIVTPSVTVRLNVGTNTQGGGDLDWDGRVLPDLEFWQMDVGLHGLSIENESLSGILGETARPVLDEDGREVMEGYEAFRGSVADYRVAGPLGTDFALLNKL